MTHEAGGGSRIDAERYLTGEVELVVEVASSSASHDLHKKKDCYVRHGVREYLVVIVHAENVVWFERDASGYTPLHPDRRGVLRSRVFPGLWLDTRALLRRDVSGMHAVLESGLASPAHARFVDNLAKKLRRARKRGR
jgi:Uma2 family endonuclease